VILLNYFSYSSNNNGTSLLSDSPELRLQTRFFRECMAMVTRTDDEVPFTPRHEARFKMADAVLECEPNRGSANAQSSNASVSKRLT
jgi:hypothetical protein